VAQHRLAVVGRTDVSELQDGIRHKAAS
jgi:hypothetical protein